jgi:SNF2 family DNA or RNA helicase
MIEISLRGNSIVAVLDPKHRDYVKARIIVRSLLGSHEVAHDVFKITYDDMTFLRSKLDLAGLVHDREVGDEALGLISQIHQIDTVNADIKNGAYNAYTLQLLEGKIKTIPYNDQVSAITYLVYNRRAGLFDTMGTGKSNMVLATTVALDVKKTLIICPLSVVIGFEREVNKHTYLKYESIPSGGKTALNFLKSNKDGDWDILFVHPENLVARGSKTKYSSDVAHILKTMTWDQVVIDEFHMYKNWEAKRTQSVVDIINTSRASDGYEPRVILMTGTPVSENPTSAYVALKLLTGNAPHFTKFENHFCVKRKIEVQVRDKITGKIGRKKVSKLTGYKNLSELKTMISRVSIRRTNVEGFPEKIPIIRDIILSGAQLKLYRAMCSSITDGLSAKSQVNIAKFLESDARALRLRQLMNHPALLDEKGDSAKYKELDYIFDEILADNEQKVVVWTEWRKSVELLYDRYNSDYGVHKIYGGVGNLELKAIRDDFEAIGSGAKIVVSIPAKGGTGLDFLARARTAIYVDRPRSYILFKQSMDRLSRRINPSPDLSELDKIRAKPYKVMFLDVISSLDVMIREEMWEKTNFADMVTADTSESFELSRQDFLKYLK